MGPVNRTRQKVTCERPKMHSPRLVFDHSINYKRLNNNFSTCFESNFRWILFENCTIFFFQMDFRSIFDIFIKCAKVKCNRVARMRALRAVFHSKQRVGPVADLLFPVNRANRCESFVIVYFWSVRWFCWKFNRSTVILSVRKLVFFFSFRLFSRSVLDESKMCRHVNILCIIFSIH